MSFDPTSPTPEIVDEAAQVVRRGGIVLYPTDTVYGLGCDPFREETVERLTMLKGRPEGKGMLVIIDNLSFVKDICINIPNVFYELSEAFWPGPVTFLLPGTSRLSHLVLGDTGKVGVRCPDLSFLRCWSRAIPGPVVSTSANLSGLPLPQKVSELRRLFGNKVDLFLDGGEPSAVNRPSTVVDVTTTPPLLVRSGQWARRVTDFLAARGASPP